MTEKFEMVAKTFQGLEGVLAEELKELGASDVTQGRRMVSFTGDMEMLYRANFACRCAVRILKPFAHFMATNADDLYRQVKDYDWSRLLDTSKSFSIDATTFGDEFNHSQYVTYRVKDAIVDYFVENEGRRPSVRLSNPDIRFDVHIAGNEVTLSLDSSGEPLFKRGWRVAQTDAPINEVLAAGILRLSGWNGNTPLIDPMCGSGTFLVEAALIAANINPGIFRKEYAFQQWPDYDADLFDKVCNDDSGERDITCKIYGWDVSANAIAIARANVKNAGVARYVELERRDLADVEQVPEGGTVVTNPPYGQRLKDDQLGMLYQLFGTKLKQVFKGYHAWIIGYNDDLMTQIGLRPSVRYPLNNGGLECQLHEYVIFEGRYNEMRERGESIKNDNFRRSEASQPRRTEKRDRDGEERPPRRFDDRPRRFEQRDRDGEERPPRRFDDRPRRFEQRDRDGEERPPRRFDDRPRRFEQRDRDGEERPPRRFDDRPRRFEQRDRDGEERPPRRFERRDGEDRHSEAFIQRTLRNRQPRLSSDKEVPIIHGRRKSWKRRDIDESQLSGPATDRPSPDDGQ